MKKKEINDLSLRKIKISHLKGGDITDPCLDSDTYEAACLVSPKLTELTKCDHCPIEEATRDCNIR